MITETFMNLPRMGLSINMAHLGHVVWDDDEVELHLVGRPEPLRVGRHDFVSALNVWLAAQERPPQPHPRALGALGSDA